MTAAVNVFNSIWHSSWIAAALATALAVLAVVFGLWGANLKDKAEPRDWPSAQADFMLSERGRPYLEASNRTAQRVRGLGLQQIAGVVGGAVALETLTGAIQSPITSILAVLWLVAAIAWSLRIYAKKRIAAQIAECWGERLVFTLRTKHVPWTPQQRDAEFAIECPDCAKVLLRAGRIGNDEPVVIEAPDPGAG
jgi:hypothetical protein